MRQYTWQIPFPCKQSCPHKEGGWDTPHEEWLFPNDHNVSLKIDQKSTKSTTLAPHVKTALIFNPSCSWAWRSRVDSAKDLSPGSKPQGKYNYFTWLVVLYWLQALIQLSMNLQWQDYWLSFWGLFKQIKNIINLKLILSIKVYEL